MKSDELLEAVRLHLHERIGVVDQRHEALARDVQASIEAQGESLNRLQETLEALKQEAERLSARQDEPPAALAPLVAEVERHQADNAGLLKRIDEVRELVAGAGLKAMALRVQQLDEAAEAARAHRDTLEQRVEEVREEVLSRAGACSDGQEQLVQEWQAFLDRAAEPADLIKRLAGEIQERIEQALRDHAETWDAALTALQESCQVQVREVEARCDQRVTEATAPLLEAAGTTGQRVERIEQSVETLAETFRSDLRAFEETVDSRVRQVDERAATLETTLESRATEVGIHAEEAARTWGNVLREELSDGIATMAAQQDERVTEALEDGFQRLRGDLLRRYTQAEAWARGGEDYKPLAIVRHRGGLWQAATRTSAEPGAGSDDWMLLVDGIHEVRYEIEEGRAWTMIRLSSGVEQRAPVPYPSFRSRGTYRAGETYNQWDVVVRNRTTFLAAQDTDSEPSNRNGHWVQLSDVVQGPKGPAGRDGRSVSRDDLIALLPQMTRMLADEMERRQGEREEADAKAQAGQVRL